MIEEKEIKEKDKIISGWINDVNIRIEALKRYGNKKNKNTENEEKAAQ